MARNLTAIAAMAKNRVIGCGNKIPWHLPEDFKFFKAKTMGGILLMGRKTYESIGKPLPGRISVVLSRKPSPRELPENVFWIQELSELDGIAPERKVFLAGGAELYAQFLPLCEDFFLTLVDACPVGDAFFPDFETLFDSGETVLETDSFKIKKYKRLK